MRVDGNARGVCDGEVAGWAEGGGWEKGVSATSESPYRDHHVPSARIVVKAGPTAGGRTSKKRGGVSVQVQATEIHVRSGG